MIVACSSCGIRYSGAGFRDQQCPACGVVATVTRAGQRICPRCELPFDAREVSDLVLDECGRCQGLFLDQVTIGRILEDAEAHARADALLAALPRREPRALPPPGGRMYIKCPVCPQTMNRKLFASGSGVVVDICKAHGTFFDAGELPAILDFVRAGGLEKAAQKQREAARPRGEPPSSSRGTSTFDAADAGGALVELLFSIFD